MQLPPLDDDEEMTGVTPIPVTEDTELVKPKKRGRKPKVEEIEEEPEFTAPDMPDDDLLPAQLINTDMDKGKSKIRPEQQWKFMTALVEEARKTTPANYFIGSESRELMIGIPTPSLPMEYLLGLDALPLGLMYQLVAETGVGKSAMLAEFARWFMSFGGGFWLVETETKFNPDWYASIMGEQMFGMTQLLRAGSLEEWQRNLTDAIKITKRSADSQGFGRKIPFLFGVDSVSGKASETEQEKILGKIGKDGLRGKGIGNAARGFATEALVNTKFIKAIPQEFDGWPFSLVTVNQLKTGMDERGLPTRSIGGGKQLGFQESVELQLSKAKGPKHKIVSSKFVGYEVNIETFKNSYSEGVKKIATRLLWRHNNVEEIIDGDMEMAPSRQHTIWDWNWSLVWLLDYILNQGGHSYFKPRLEALGIHVTCPTRADVENKAWSKTLGMSGKDAVSWSRLGAMLHANPEIVKKIRKGLCIAHIPTLTGDYANHLERLINRAK